MANGDDVHTWAAWFIGIMGSAIAFISGWVWKIKTGIDEVRHEGGSRMADIERDTRDRIEASERNTQQMLESAVRLLQEDLAEIKESIHTNAMFVRDNFARRDTMVAISAEIRVSMTATLDRLEQQIREDRVKRDAAFEDIMNRVVETILNNRHKNQRD